MVYSLFEIGANGLKEGLRDRLMQSYAYTDINGYANADINTIESTPYEIIDDWVESVSGSTPSNEPVSGIKIVKYNLPSRWSQEIKTWVDDEYLDYSKFQKYLYTNENTLWVPPYRDFLRVDNLTGFDDFDNKVFYYYYTHSYKPWVGRGGCILRSKEDLSFTLQLDGGCDYAYSKTLPVIEEVQQTIPEYSWFMGRYILLSDVIELSKLYGKGFVMDLLKDITTEDEFEINEDSIDQQVKEIMNKSL